MTCASKPWNPGFLSKPYMVADLLTAVADQLAAPKGSAATPTR